MIGLGWVLLLLGVLSMFAPRQSGVAIGVLVGMFLFLGGLQFNWIWAKRLPYTEYDLTTFPVVKVKADTGGTRTEFYIAFDF